MRRSISGAIRVRLTEIERTIVINGMRELLSVFEDMSALSRQEAATKRSIEGIITKVRQSDM
ncbi:hypothetical protein [Devosia sp.]|uniref:hypothetical protein n=1 Tax=Devosia sp. TaxID=1871048 RepID=UPI00273690EA|nr:hypothetical protein [Devosia sp.]MDP2779766.1 hypothetical protein [Devosia sp.]